MTSSNSQDLPLFNFERLDILFPRIGHPCEKLRPFECLKSFRWSISSVLNRKTEWKVMTIGISRELLSLNFKHLNIFYPRIEHPCENLWQFEFLESFSYSILSVTICYASESDIHVKSYDHLNFSRASVFQFWASRYVMHLNRTSVWNVMSIWISRELPLFNFKLIDMLCAKIGHPSEKLSPFEFLMSFHCSISSVSICYAPQSDIRVKSYDHFNFSWAFNV